MAALRGDGLRAAILLVRMKGLEPPRPETLDPKSNAATNYATCAGLRAKVGIFLEIAKFFLFGGGGSFWEHSEISECSECSEEWAEGGGPVRPVRPVRRVRQVELFGERGGWTLCEVAAAPGSSPTFLGDCS